MVVVYASKGPLAGRQVDIPQDQVDAATGKGGWAIKIEPGNQLLADPSAEYDPSWVIPGYSTEDLKPFTKEGKQAAAKETTKEPEKPTASTKAAAASTPPSESSSKTSAAATASDSNEKAAADEDKAEATKTKASSK